MHTRHCLGRTEYENNFNRMSNQLNRFIKKKNHKTFNDYPGNLGHKGG